MRDLDPVKCWIDNIGYSHSNSERTAKSYRIGLQLFCNFIETTPREILADYEASNDRTFKRKYAGFLRAWVSELRDKGWTPKTIKMRLATIQSFFKYNGLPLGHIPSGRATTTYFNRDISHDEINHVLSICKPREKAFFCMIAQSGLRPYTLCQLQVKDVEGILEDETPIPCLVEVPCDKAKGKYSAYFTFLAEESVAYLKNYLKTRVGLTPESLLFSQYGKEKRLERRNLSNVFHKHLNQLKKRGLITFEQKAHRKPSEIRLYNLRKFFRKFAAQAGLDFVAYWMGHTSMLGVDLAYFSQDPEHHRKIYAEKAMPHLRLETATPRETEQTIKEMRKEIEKLRQENLKLQQRLDGTMLSENQVQELLQRIEKLEKQAQK